MADDDGTPRLPAQFEADRHSSEFNVSELMSDNAGAHSPFGELEFPLPYQALTYTHPTAADRPNLADGR